MSSFVPQRAGDVRESDDDALLMAKAKELQERARCKAESLEKFEKSSKNRQEYRVKTLHNACTHNGLTDDVSNILMMVQDGVDIDGEWLNRGYEEAPSTAIYRASRTGHTRAIQCLIQHGADFERERPDGNRPLHVAAAFGHFEAMDYLVSQGADFTARNKASQSPWLLAFERHDDKGKKCLASLEKEGAEVEEKEKCIVQ